MRYIVCIGSSQPNGATYINQTIQFLGRHAPVNVLAISQIRSGQAIGSARPFIVHNAAFALTSTLYPEALWFAMAQAERRFGRLRPFGNAPRTIDLDLAWWDGTNFQGQFITLPHPRLFSRAFAWLPTQEVAEICGWSECLAKTKGHQAIGKSRSATRYGDSVINS